jgi:hypothetical protein
MLYSNGDDTFLPLGGRLNGFLIGIYQDQYALPDTSVDPTDDDKDWINQVGWRKEQIYTIDNASSIPDAIVGRRTWDTFSTSIALSRKDQKKNRIVNEHRKDVWQRPYFGYPWDEWEGSIVFVANNYSRGLDQGRPNSYVLPTKDAILVDSACKFRC